MQPTSATKPEVEAIPDSVTVYCNRQAHTMDCRTYTGEQLYKTFGISDEHDLWRMNPERPEASNKVVPKAKYNINFNSGNKFFTSPKYVNG